MPSKLSCKHKGKAQAFITICSSHCGLEAVCTPQCKLKGLTFAHKLYYLFFLLPHHLDQSFLCRLLPGKGCKCMHTHKYQERTSILVIKRLNGDVLLPSGSKFTSVLKATVVAHCSFCSFWRACSCFLRLSLS